MKTIVVTRTREFTQTVEVYCPESLDSPEMKSAVMSAMDLREGEWKENTNQERLSYAEEEKKSTWVVDQRPRGNVWSCW